MEEQNYDLLLSLADNGGQRATVVDLVDAGLTADNTDFLSKDEYKGKLEVQDRFTDPTTGKFNDELFDKVYDSAEAAYKQLGTLSDIKKTSNVFNDKTGQFSTAWQKLISATDRSRVQTAKGDTFTSIPESQKIDILKSSWTKEANPYRNSKGLEKAFGLDGQKPWTVEELAAMNPVKDYETGKTLDTPGFFNSLPFFNGPTVLAQYEEDTYDEDGTFHAKGSPKLNENGGFYYETLGNRSVYGKTVFNAFNNLTDERDWINKYDFFDSDDKNQKNWLGSVLKTVCLVGPMFLPYVGPVIAGASVLMQLSSMFGTASKMATDMMGIETMKWQNTLEAWSKTYERNAVTEYSKKNLFTFENMVALAGEACAQLKEQRWIMELPIKLAGLDARLASEYSKAATPEKMEAILNKTIEKKFKAKFQKELSESVGKISEDNIIFQKLRQQELTEALNSAHKLMAKDFLDKLLRSNINIASPISKAYMTFLTTRDSYGEAIQAGLPKDLAFALAVGYTIGEALLLNTSIGERILPELHMDKLLMRNKIKSIVGDTVKELKDLNIPEHLSKELETKTIADVAKRSFIKAFPKFNKLGPDYVGIGEEFGGVTWAKALSSAALGEALEETSEEILADLSKSAMSLYRDLKGQEKIDLGEWQDWDKRYIMSALGGAIGGGMNHAITHFQGGFDAIRNFGKFEGDSKDAILSIALDPEQLELFMETLDAMPIASTVLSFDFDKQSLTYNTAKSYNESLDAVIKSTLKNLINFTKTSLESEGASYSAESVMKLMTGEALKSFAKAFNLRNLRNTTTLDFYVLHFRNLQHLLLHVKNELANYEKNSEGINKGPKDSQSLSESEKAAQQKLLAQREEILAEIAKYKSGEIIPEVAEVALWEANPSLKSAFMNKNFAHESLYAEAKYGKDYSQLTLLEKDQAHEEYAKIKDDPTEAEHIFELYKVFKHVMSDTSNTLKESIEDLNKDVELQAAGLKDLAEHIETIHKTFKNLDESSLDDEAVLKFSNEINSLFLQNSEESNTLIAESLDEAFSELNSLNPFKLSDTDPVPLKRIKENAKPYITVDPSSNTATAFDNPKFFLERNFMFIATILQDYKKLKSSGLQEHTVKIGSASRDLFKVYEISTRYILNALNNLHATLNKLQNFEYIHPQMITYLLNAYSSLNNIVTLLDEERQRALKVSSPSFDYKNSQTHAYLMDLKKSINSEKDLLITTSLGKLKLEVPVFKILTSFIDKLSNNSTATERSLDLLDRIHSLIRTASTTKSELRFDQLFLDDASLKDIQVLFSLIDTLKSILNALRKDNADIYNLKGYSPLLNNINKALNISNNDLIELNSQDVDLILSNLDKVTDILNNYISIYNINSESKLREEPKLFINDTVNFYNCYKLTCCTTDEDKHDLEEKFPNLLHLSLLTLKNNFNPSSDFTVDDELLAKITAEKISLELGMHEMFNANFVENGKLKIDEFSTFLATTVLKGTNMMDKSNLSLSLENRAYNYRLFAELCVFITALAPAKFYSAYKESIENLTEIAPVYGLEIALKNAISYRANLPLVDDGILAIKEAFIKNFNYNKEDESFLNSVDRAFLELFSSPEKLMATNLSPEHLRALLINGMPGVGKSKAVFALILDILLRVNPEAVKNFGYAHTEVENADHVIQDFSEKFGKDKINAKTFSKESLLKYFYTDDFFALNNSEVLINSDKENNLLIVDNKEGEVLSNGVIKLNPKVKSYLKLLNDVPLIIFIDEVSHFTEGEIEALTLAAALHGIMLYFGGDFTLASILQIIKSSEEAKDGPLKTESVADTFMTLQKLTTLLRTNNNVLTASIKALNTHINNVLEDKGEATVPVQYYIDDSTFKGIYKASLSPLEAIDFIKQRSTPDLKIFYIVENDAAKETDRVKSINDPRITVKTVKEALGLEVDYVIYDADFLATGESSCKNFYTAATRAFQGVLHIGSGSEILTQRDSWIEEKMSERAIEKARESKLKALNSLNLSEFPLTKDDFKPLSKVQVTETLVAPEEVLKQEDENAKKNFEYASKAEAELALEELGVFKDDKKWRPLTDPSKTITTSKFNWTVKESGDHTWLIKVSYTNENSNRIDEEDAYKFFNKYEGVPSDKKDIVPTEVLPEEEGLSEEGGATIPSDTEDPFQQELDIEEADEEFASVVTEFAEGVSRQAPSETSAYIQSFNSFTGTGIFTRENGEITDTSIVDFNHEAFTDDKYKNQKVKDFIGLAKLWRVQNPDKDLTFQQLYTDLRLIKYYLFFIKDSKQVKSAILQYLKLKNYIPATADEDHFKVIHGVLKSDYENPAKSYEACLQNAEFDSVYGVNTGLGDYDAPPGKSCISAFGFTDDTGEFLDISFELTVGPLPFPGTALKSIWSEKANELATLKDKKQIMQFLRDLVSEIDDKLNTLPEGKFKSDLQYLQSLLNLYFAEENMFLKIPDADESFSWGNYNYGLTYMNRKFSHMLNDHVYVPSWQDLDNLPFMHTVPLRAKNTITIGDTTIKKGLPFVIVSMDPSKGKNVFTGKIDTKEIIDNFIKLEKNIITDPSIPREYEIYGIAAPNASFGEFIENLINGLTKCKPDKKSIGCPVHLYYMMQMLQEEGWFDINKSDRDFDAETMLILNARTSIGPSNIRNEDQIKEAYSTINEILQRIDKASSGNSFSLKEILNESVLHNTKARAVTFFSAPATTPGKNYFYQWFSLYLTHKRLDDGTVVPLKINPEKTGGTFKDNLLEEEDKKIFEEKIKKLNDIWDKYTKGSESNPPKTNKYLGKVITYNMKSDGTTQAVEGIKAFESTDLKFQCKGKAESPVFLCPEVAQALNSSEPLTSEYASRKFPLKNPAIKTDPVQPEAKTLKDWFPSITTTTIDLSISAETKEEALEKLFSQDNITACNQNNELIFNTEQGPRIFKSKAFLLKDGEKIISQELDANYKLVKFVSEFENLQLTRLVDNKDNYLTYNCTVVDTTPLFKEDISSNSTNIQLKDPLKLGTQLRIRKGERQKKPHIILEIHMPDAQKMDDDQPLTIPLWIPTNTKFYSPLFELVKEKDEEVFPVENLKLILLSRVKEDFIDNILGDLIYNLNETLYPRLNSKQNARPYSGTTNPADYAKALFPSNDMNSNSTVQVNIEEGNYLIQGTNIFKCTGVDNENKTVTLLSIEDTGNILEVNFNNNSNEVNGVEYNKLIEDCIPKLINF